MNLIANLSIPLFRILRKENNCRLFWSVYYPFNFGDWIGPFIFSRITNKEPLFNLPNNFSRHTVIMSAGSILSLARHNCIIWGSGIISRKDEFQRPWKILSVRGPYSRERCLKLGYSCPDIFGDPAILLPLLYNPESKKIRYELGIIPHFRDIDYIKRKNESFVREDVLIIDVRYPIEQVIDKICSCKRIVSSSLHGIIVAQAYGIPVGWVSFGKRLGGDGIKFYDHYASIGCYKPECLNNALEIPVKELTIYAESCIQYCFKEIKNKLLSVCPFIN